MPLKSVVQIEIDDSDFKRFAAAFAKYNEALKATPDAWQAAADGAAKTATASEEAATATEAAATATEAVGVATAATATAFLEIGVTVKSASAELQKISTENAKLTKTAATQASAWKGMAENAGKFASRIYDATRSLLRWSELTGLIGGILGGGGLWGIDRLAISAGNQRRNALGLGTTPGEAAAFDVNYSRLFDTHQFLGGVNEALHDVTKRVGLYGAGLTERDLQGKDTAQVGAELIPYLKKLADQTPESMLGNVLQARHLDQFMTLQDFERLKHTPAGELDDYGRRFQKDQNELNLPSATAKAWQDLQVQFSRAGATLENTLIKGLVGLAGPIENLSTAFTKLVADLLRQGGPLSVWIDELGKGIDWLGREVNKPEFEEAIVSFISSVTELAKKIPAFVEEVGELIDALGGAAATIANWFKGVDDKNGPLSDDNPNAPGSPAFYRAHPQFDRNPDLSDPVQGADGFDAGGARRNWDLSGAMPWNWFRPHLAPAAPPPPTDVQKQRFDQLEGQQGLPPGLLNSVMQAESRGDPNATSPAGAKGYFQFVDSTAARYNVHDPRDFNDSSSGASRYLHDLLIEFHGDMKQALAGYNWGEKNVEKDIAEHGNAWLNYAPTETQGYVGKVMAGVKANGFDTPDLIRQFHGDLAKVAAASKVGAATVEDDVKKYGAEWKSHLPIDVQNYITSVSPPAPQKTSFIPRANGPDRVAINVNNMTGGNAYISSSQLAVG